eukprot:313814_1
MEEQKVKWKLYLCSCFWMFLSLSLLISGLYIIINPPRTCVVWSSGEDTRYWGCGTHSYKWNAECAENGCTECYVDSIICTSYIRNSECAKNNCTECYEGIKCTPQNNECYENECTECYADGKCSSYKWNTKCTERAPGYQCTECYEDGKCSSYNGSMSGVGYVLCVFGLCVFGCGMFCCYAMYNAKN